MLQQYTIVAIQPAVITIRLATSQVIEVPFTRYMNVDGANKCDKCGTEHNRFLDEEVISCNCDGTSDRYFPESKISQYASTVVSPNRPNQNTAPSDVAYVTGPSAGTGARLGTPIPPLYRSEWPTNTSITEYSNCEGCETTTTTTTW